MVISPGMIERGASVFIFFLITGLLLGGMFTYWRDIHNAADPESKILKATAGNIPSLYNISNSLSNLFLQKYESNEVFLRIGILKNCKNLVTGDTSDLPENIGFVGDTAITAILTLTIALYAFNFVIALISLYAPKATYILPFSAFCGLTLIAAPIVIFIAYNNEIYMSVKQKILTPDYERSELKRLYDMSVHDYYISYRFPLIISYGVGFYIIVVAFAVSILGFFMSIAAAVFALNNAKKSVEKVPQPQQQLHQQQQPSSSSSSIVYDPVQQQHLTQRYPPQTPPAYQQPPPQQPYQQYPTQIYPQKPVVQSYPHQQKQRTNKHQKYSSQQPPPVYEENQQPSSSQNEVQQQSSDPYSHSASAKDLVDIPL